MAFQRRRSPIKDSLEDGRNSRANSDQRVSQSNALSVQFFCIYKIRKLKGLDVQILRHCLTFFSSVKHFFSIIFMYYSTYYYSVLLYSTYIIILLNYIMILLLLLCFA